MTWYPTDGSTAAIWLHFDYTQNVATISFASAVFDPAKDAINILKHGISLKCAEDFDFSTSFIRVDDREDYGELRYRAIGWLDASLFVLVFTQSGENFRAISLRSATRQERKQYATKV